MSFGRPLQKADRTEASAEWLRIEYTAGQTTPRWLPNVCYLQLTWRCSKRVKKWKEKKRPAGGLCVPTIPLLSMRSRRYNVKTAWLQRNLCLLSVSKVMGSLSTSCLVVLPVTKRLCLAVYAFAVSARIRVFLADTTFGHDASRFRIHAQRALILRIFEILVWSPFLTIGLLRDGRSLRQKLNGLELAFGPLTAFMRKD